MNAPKDRKVRFADGKVAEHIDARVADVDDENVYLDEYVLWEGEVHHARVTIPISAMQPAEQEWAEGLLRLKREITDEL